MESAFCSKTARIEIDIEIRRIVLDTFLNLSFISFATQFYVTEVEIRLNKTGIG